MNTHDTMDWIALCLRMLTDEQDYCVTRWGFIFIDCDSYIKLPMDSDLTYEQKYANLYEFIRAYNELDEPTVQTGDDLCTPPLNLTWFVSTDNLVITMWSDLGTQWERKVDWHRLPEEDAELCMQIWGARFRESGGTELSGGLEFNLSTGEYYG